MAMGTVNEASGAYDSEEYWINSLERSEDLLAELLQLQAEEWLRIPCVWSQPWGIGLAPTKMNDSGILTTENRWPQSGLQTAGQEGVEIW